MQSSIAILLRAALLLGVLTTLPLIAAGGVGSVDKFLAEAKGWLDRHQQVGPLTAPRTIQVELPAEALQYRDFSPIGEIHAAQPETQNNSPENLPRADHFSRDAGGSLGISSTPEIQLVSNEFQQTTPDHSARNEWQSPRFPQAEALPMETNPRHLSAQQVEQQLRQQGAVAVSLEPWGNSGNLYRYRVQMAMGMQGDVETHFQAFHANPDTAAQDVLLQVQAWLQR